MNDLFELYKYYCNLLLTVLAYRIQQTVFINGKKRKHYIFCHFAYRYIKKSRCERRKAFDNKIYSADHSVSVLLSTCI